MGFLLSSERQTAERQTAERQTFFGCHSDERRSLLVRSGFPPIVGKTNRGKTNSGKINSGKANSGKTKRKCGGGLKLNKELKSRSE